MAIAYIEKGWESSDEEQCEDYDTFDGVCDEDLEMLGLHQPLAYV